MASQGSKAQQSCWDCPRPPTWFTLSFFAFLFTAAIAVPLAELQNETIVLAVGIPAATIVYGVLFYIVVWRRIDGLEALWVSQQSEPAPPGGGSFNKDNRRLEVYTAVILQRIEFLTVAIKAAQQATAALNAAAAATSSNVVQQDPEVLRPGLNNVPPTSPWFNRAPAASMTLVATTQSGNRDDEYSQPTESKTRESSTASAVMPIRDQPEDNAEVRFGSCRSPVIGAPECTPERVPY